MDAQEHKQCNVAFRKEVPMLFHANLQPHFRLPVDSLSNKPFCSRWGFTVQGIHVGTLYPPFVLHLIEGCHTLKKRDVKTQPHLDQAKFIDMTVHLLRTRHLELKSIFIGPAFLSSCIYSRKSPGRYIDVESQGTVGREEKSCFSWINQSLRKGSITM